MSRRFKNRHRKVLANPDALPDDPVVLDDSNSYVDPLQPDVRKPLHLNRRHYATAESIVAKEFEELEEPAAADGG